VSGVSGVYEILGGEEMNVKRAGERVTNYLTEALMVADTLRDELVVKSPTDWRITVLALAKMIQEESGRTEYRRES